MVISKNKWIDNETKIFIVLFCRFTKRKTWGNWNMIHTNLWVSFSTGTSRVNRHTHDFTEEDRKQELAIFSITIIVQRLGASFAFTWQKVKVLMVCLPPTPIKWSKKIVQKNSPKNAPRNAPKNSPRVQWSSPYVTLYLFCHIIVIYTHLNAINLWNRAINIFISL